ncbi:MAG: hypothetical protein WBA13_10350 [Microcoleaceae cyanobacterium]
MTQEQMKSSQMPSFVIEMDLSQNSEDSLTLAWLNLVSQTVDDFGADDWLSLCPDINEGELYRDWFIWYDEEVAQEWEAYDPITELRYVDADLKVLKAKIDNIEITRHQTTTAA